MGGLGEAAADSRELSRQHRLLRGLVVASLAWAAVYLLFQGQDGVLAQTVEHVDSAWLRFTVLNVPLQLALTLVASFGLGREAPRVATRTGLWLAGLNLVLIAGHLIVTAVTG